LERGNDRGVRNHSDVSIDLALKNLAGENSVAGIGPDRYTIGHHRFAQRCSEPWRKVANLVSMAHYDKPGRELLNDLAKGSDIPVRSVFSKGGVLDQID